MGKEVSYKLLVDSASSEESTRKTVHQHYHETTIIFLPFLFLEELSREGLSYGCVS